MYTFWIETSMEGDRLIHALELVEDWILVLEGRTVVYVNQRMLEDMEKTSDQVLGRPLDTVVPQEYCDNLEAFLVELERAQEIPKEQVLVCNDPLLGPMTHRVRGEHRGGLTFVWISNSASSEEPGHRLAELQDRLSAFLALTASAGIGVGVFEIRDDGSLHIRSLNQHALALFGRTEEEMLERSPLEFIHPDDKQTAEGSIRELLDTGSSDPILIRVYDPDGELIRLRIAQTMLSTAEGNVGIGFIQDLTSTYEALEQENRMVRAIEHIEETVVLGDANGDIVYANPAALRNSGYTFEEVVGRPISMFMSPEVEAAVGSGILEEFMTRGWWRGDVMACAKDGTRYPVEVIGSMLRDERDQMSGVVVVSRKIEERQTFEAQLIMARSSHDWVRWMIETKAFPRLERAVAALAELRKEAPGETVTQGIGRAIEEIEGLIGDARDRLSKLPSSAGTDHIEPMRLAPAIIERLPMVQDRMRARGLEFSIATGTVDEDIKVMANTMLPDLFTRLIDVVATMASPSTLDIVLDIESVAISDIPGLTSMPEIDPDSPCFARVTLTISDVVLSEEMRAALARREMPTRGAPSHQLKFAIETSRLLAFSFRGQVHAEDIDQEDPGRGFKVVVLLPLAGVQLPAQPSGFPLFDEN